MEDKIINTSEEFGEMTVTLKNGKAEKIKAKTVYTHWESGRKDCAITLIEPISATGKQEK